MSCVFSIGRIRCGHRAQVRCHGAIAIAFVMALAGRSVAAEESPAYQADPENLLSMLRMSANVEPEPGGVRVEADQQTMLVFPFQGATHMAFDVETAGPFLLTWFVSDRRMRVRHYGPPWMYVELRPNQAQSLDIDLLQLEDWFAGSVPGVILHGTGTVHLKNLHYWVFPGSEEDARKAHDAALRFARDSIGHVTINTLTPATWSWSRRLYVPQVIAVAGFVCFLVVLVALRARAKRWLVYQAAVAAILAAVVAHDSYALGRLVPAFHLRVQPDPEKRIRDNYYFAPDLGALASLARSTIGPGEKVGIQADAGDWFGSQTLCFNLAPRPCVILDQGRASGLSISKVNRLGIGDLDVLVLYNAQDPLVSGFVQVAGLNRNAYVARRKP